MESKGERWDELLKPDEVEDAFIKDFMSVKSSSVDSFADCLVENYISETTEFPSSLLT